MRNNLPTEQELEEGPQTVFFKSRTLTRAKLAAWRRNLQPSNERRDISVTTGIRSRRWPAIVWWAEFWRRPSWCF